MEISYSTINSCKISKSSPTAKQRVINGIFFNQNHSLISTATDNGYLIYESYNFLRVSEEDEYGDLIGPLKIAIPFYDSQLVMFVGKDEQSTFPHTQIVLWDDIKKMKIGVILLKEKIIDAKIAKEAIYVLIEEKILVFSLKTLTHIYTVQDVDHIKSQKLFMSYNTNPVVLVNVSLTRPNQLKITKCKQLLIIFIVSTEQYEIKGKVHLVISLPFKSIYKFNISRKGDTVIIVGYPLNKIHIFSLIDFQQKFCLDSDFPHMKIIDISISKKSKFFSILYSDFNLEVYNLTEEKKVNQTCNCMNELLSGELIPSILPKESLSKKTKNFLFGTFSKLKGIMFEKSKKSFCKYKFNPYYDDEESLHNENNFNNVTMPIHTLVQFDKVNEIVRIFVYIYIIIDSRGIVEKLKFNTKEGGYCWCYKTIYWLLQERNGTLGIFHT